MPVITSVFPSPNSMKMFLHIMQLIATGRFCEYDYGVSRNMKAYNRANPPDYNLTNVRVPISIIVGENDNIAHPEVCAKVSAMIMKLRVFFQLLHFKIF